MKLPKLYNPFKAHIIELANGKFIVRRLNLMGWKHKEHTTLSHEDVYWWNYINHSYMWCCVNTYDEAIILRDKVHIKEPKPTKVVRVYG